MASLKPISTRQLGNLEPSEPGVQNVWEPTPAIMVDTSDTLTHLVDTLASLENGSDSVYMDLEGVRLSRYGTISLIQILVPSCKQAFIVDVHTLGKTAFDTLGSKEKSLRDTLESSGIKKYLFDVRNDSDALYGLFGVQLANVVDIQLLELASREGDKRGACGLARCTDQEQVLPLRASEQWQITKKEVVKMFDPKLGGTYEVFNVRPLPRAIMEYCVGDVETLPLLSAIYESRLDRTGLEKVQVETEKRLEKSRTPRCKRQGKQNRAGPKKRRSPPKEGQKSDPAITASASKKRKELIAPAAAQLPKESTAAVAAPPPREKEKSTAAVGGAAPKKKELSSAAAGDSSSKKTKKPPAVPTPNKGKNLVAPVAAPVSKNGEKSTAKVPIPAPKRGKKAAAAERGFTSKKEKNPTTTAASVFKKLKSTTTATSPAPEKEEKPAAIVPALAPKRGTKSTAVVPASASKKRNESIEPLATQVPKEGKNSSATVSAATASKKEKKPTAVEGGSAAKKGKKPTATAASASQKGDASTVIGGPAPQKKEKSTATVTGGGGKGKPKVGGGKGKSKHPSTSAYSNISFRDDMYAKDWSICDKDCGWCGRCGDGIL